MIEIDSLEERQVALGMDPAPSLPIPTPFQRSSSTATRTQCKWHAPEYSGDVLKMYEEEQRKQRETLAARVEQKRKARRAKLANSDTAPA